MIFVLIWPFIWFFTVFRVFIFFIFILSVMYNDVQHDNNLWSQLPEEIVSKLINFSII